MVYCKRGVLLYSSEKVRQDKGAEEAQTAAGINIKK